jgi:hypothetical protein
MKRVILTYPRRQSVVSLSKAEERPNDNGALFISLIYGGGSGKRLQAFCADERALLTI